MLANSQERLLRLALHCYPERWRARHGNEARELAILLVQDGVPLRSTTWSYFKGAAKERLRARGRRLRAGAAALVAATSLMAMSLLISVPPSPAGAAPVVRAVISNRSQAAAELEEVFRAHHFDITVEQLPVSPSLVGSILGTKILGRSTGSAGILGRVTGTCAGGQKGAPRGCCCRPTSPGTWSSWSDGRQGLARSTRSRATSSGPASYWRAVVCWADRSARR